MNSIEEKGETLLPKKAPSKNDALEALDFIINVLKEHEKDLDRLISDLGTITDRLGDTGEFSGKIEKVETRLTTLQNEITNLITYLSTSDKPIAVPMQVEQREEVKPSEVRGLHGPPVILRCKQWDDFRTLAHKAQTLSFMYKATEKKFQVDALKDSQIITYSGDPPKETYLLKTWLSKQLEIPEQKILEGILAIG